MKFWDSSAVVQLLVEQPGSAALRALLGVDPVVVAWWGTSVECVSGIARLEREGNMAASEVHAALAAGDGEPRRLPFVCRDERLRVAADREGLPLV